MFTNEEFDPDEDFLDDVSQIESCYYSRAPPSDEKSSTEGLRNDKESSQPSGSKSISHHDEPMHMKADKDFLVPNANLVRGKKTVGKSLILQRLKRHGNTVSDPSIHQHSPKINKPSLNLEKSNLAEEPSLQSSNESRKFLLMQRLQRFQRNDTKSILASPHCPEEKSGPTNRSTVSSNNSKLEHCTKLDKSQEKSLKPLYNKTLTVVRRFPGPAGLLPDLASGIIPQLIPDSSSLDYSKDVTGTDDVDNSMIPQYCSQNTTNSFSKGPWQLLMSDLSPDFLSGHEISTIQRKVLTNSYRNNKVPFMAGIVQRVDYNCLDPLIVLEDFTGVIEGTVCKEILIEYPHSLDIGVVLFLGNVGLLTIGSYPKKCHFIITLKNIINVYTETAKIFSTSEMDTRLRNLNKHSYTFESANRISDGSSSSNSKLRSAQNVERVRAPNLIIGGNLCSRSNYKSLQKVAEECSTHTRENVNLEAPKSSTYVCTDLPVDSPENMGNFQANLNSFQQADYRNSKSTFESEEFPDFVDDFTASFSEIDDNMMFKTATHSDSVINCSVETNIVIPVKEDIIAPEKNSVLKTIHLNTNLSHETERSISKISNVGTESAEKFKAKHKTAAATETSNPPSTSGIRLKLSLFQSKTELTPLPSEDRDLASTAEIQKENYERIELSSTYGLLLNEEIDSEEELLSQLDVESIVSDYNKRNDIN